MLQFTLTSSFYLFCQLVLYLLALNKKDWTIIIILLPAVVSYLGGGHPATWFDNGRLPCFSEWSQKVAAAIANKNTKDLLDAMASLADALKEVQKGIDPKALGKPEPGATIAFSARDAWHAGVGAVKEDDVNKAGKTEHAGVDMVEEDDDRLIIYSTGIPTFLHDEMRRGTVLRRRYSAEYVLDRRTMVQPATLIRILKAMDVCKKERADALAFLIENGPNGSVAPVKGSSSHAPYK